MPLFHKIRKNEIKIEGLKRYFLYAIGEIVLVVLGILIALEINNWNEGKKTTQQEALYLQRLLLENKQDILTIDKSIAALERGNQSIQHMTRMLSDKTVTDSALNNSVSAYLLYGSMYPLFNPSTSTFEDLASTGNLEVIGDTKLRDQIVTHYTNYKYTESNFELNTKWVLAIDAPFYTDHDFLNHEPTTTDLFGEMDSREAAAELKDRKAMLIRNAAAHSWANTACIRLLRDIRKETNNLIKELKRTIALKNDGEMV